jgi:hypothetical protein
MDDMQHATTLLEYVALESRLLVRARQFHITDTTAVEILDDDHCIRADIGCSVFVSRRSLVAEERMAGGMEVVMQHYVASPVNRCVITGPGCITS